MVLPFSSKSTSTPEPVAEPPRILTEEEQILLDIDKGTHEVKILHLHDQRILASSSSVCLLFRHAWMVNPFD